MDKELLKQYDALQKEQQFLAREIRRIRSALRDLKGSVVSDTVVGSREDLTVGPIKVSGSPTREYELAKERLASRQKRYEASLMRTEELLLRIDEEIEDVEDASIRMIIRLKYTKAKTWSDVGKAMKKSGDWARKKLERFMAGDA